MFGLGIGELVIIMVIVILIFGAGKLGDVGGDFGKAIRNFRKAMNEPEAIDVTPKDEGSKTAEGDKKRDPGSKA
jgi:sec-independent protein translocase protein TatA